MELTAVIAANMRRHRKNAGISQVALAKKICVAQACISAYETAKTMPMIDKAIEICLALGITLEDLVEGYV